MDVEKLRELERRATPGKWKTDLWSIKTEFGGDVIAIEWGYYDDADLTMDDADAALIVALRNAAPEIIEKLARIEKLERVAEAARFMYPHARTATLNTALADLDGGNG